MPSLLDPTDENPAPDDSKSGWGDVYTMVTDAADRAKRYVLGPGLVDPIWPTSNPVGTEKFVDYRGWDRPTAPSAPQLPPDAVSTAIQPAPNTEYGEVLPIARDTNTGEMRIAMPNSVRSFLQGGYDLSQGPRTGTVTPDATMTLLGLAVPELGTESREGELLSFGGSRRAARQAETEARVKNTGLLDDVIGKTERQQSGGLLGDSPMLRALTDLTPEESTVSTRIPYAKGLDYDPHTTSDLKVGIDSATAVPKHAEANVGYFRNYPGLNLRVGAAWQAANDALINHLGDNILSTFDAVPHDVAERNAGWYDGAHALTRDLAGGDNSPYTHQNVAGAMAALSPQKDWFENVELGKRLLDIDLNHQDTAWSPEMTTRADAYVAQKYKEADQLAAKKTREAQAKNPSAPVVAPDYTNINATNNIIVRLRDGNATYGSLAGDPMDQAVWARFRDEAHNTDRSYPEIFPDGTYGGTVMQEGDPTKINPVKWGSFVQIANALDALHAQDLATLSRSLGDNHKVRSFYNNIIFPDEPNGAVTSDTHAIAAGLFRPVGSKDVEVSQGLGSGASKNAETGNKGLYGLYDEAYRQTANLIRQRYAQNPDAFPDWHADILPRQVQSVTWEAIRRLFDNKSEANKTYAKDQWQQVGKGLIDAATARQNIVTRHGGYGY